MPNRVIEIHDSGLESLSIDSDQVVLDFWAAYIHQSDGRPAIDPGTGWVQRAIVRIYGRIESGALKELPCDLSDGFLMINDEKFKNVIPVPLDCQGNIRLNLISEFAEEINIQGRHVKLELIGEPTYVEKFPG